MPARRKMATNASSAATTQTTVCSRFTGTPSNAARSALSALARMATPAADARRKTARAAIASGMAMIAIKSFARKIVPPISTLPSKGWSNRLEKRRGEPNRRGRRIEPAASSWARPSVATVRRRRGVRKNRRITTSSTTAPRTTAPTRPTPSDTRYGQPHAVVSISMRTTGIVPRSACAKLTMRLAR